MATEVFTDYTEVDANGKLIVTASKAEGANVGRDEDVYLYKDFGADYFNGISIDFELYGASTSVPVVVPAVGFLGFANVIDDVSGWGTTDISAGIGETVAVGFIIYLIRGPNLAVDYFAASADTLYYCSLGRATDSDTATLEIYSDAARSNLLDTLAVSGFGTTKWRYCYGFVNWNDGYAGIEFDGYVQNLDLSIPPGVSELTGRFVVHETTLRYIDGYGDQRYIEGTAVE